MLPVKIKKWLQIRFRNNCLLCDADLIGQYQEPFIEKSIVDLCIACRKQCRANILCCACCAIPLKTRTHSEFSQQDSRKHLCGACQKQKPLWEKALSSFVYEYPVDRLLIALKYQTRIDYTKSLASLLVQDVELEYDFENTEVVKPDCIVPVPLHLFRECRRGYNQAHLLARELCKQLGFPLQTKLIKRTRHTPQQSRLSKKQREKNLRKAFAINVFENIPKYIVLVDDVMTTGSTAHAVTKLLLDAGVQRVDVWCVARAE